ncbi:MAG TPA: glycosyltransferase family 4 protein, partial [Candidatus Polarisedimenticolaceae bacterium]|nr:glycosyltransferase family 4 protein [Candidatus Polarisedimenticolaceae bacterium]
MRIAYVSAGAGGMYCGSCLHDQALAAALLRQGHEVTLVPTYTPIRTDAESVSVDRVFYGAVHVYLRQTVPLLRFAPRALDRLLDSPRLLAWAGRRGGTVDARRLGALTLSMLEGESGRQRQDLRDLVEWLRELRPEIVHLTNSMLLGLARQIRAELRVPLLCSLQGEDLFLDQLVEPYRGRVLACLRERARDVDGFVVASRYYAAHMAPLLGVPAERLHVVRMGVKLEGHEGDPAPSARPFVVGYLARRCPEKGLHLLVEAFRQLVERDGADAWRLRIAGYLGPRDRAYFDSILERVRAAGLADRVEVLGEIDRQQKLDFLRTVHAVAVPTTYREPKGRFALEALASGVPLVLP